MPKASVWIILQNLIVFCTCIYLGFDAFGLWAVYFAQALIYFGFSMLKLIFLKDYFVSANTMALNGSLYSNISRSRFSKIYLLSMLFTYTCVLLTIFTVAFLVVVSQRLGDSSFILGLVFSIAIYVLALIFDEIKKKTNNSKEYIDFYVQLPLQKIIFQTMLPAFIAAILFYLLSPVISLVGYFVGFIVLYEIFNKFGLLIIVFFGKTLVELGERQFIEDSYSDLLGMKKNKKYVDYIHEDTPENDLALRANLNQFLPFLGGFFLILFLCLLPSFIDPFMVANLVLLLFLIPLLWLGFMFGKSALMGLFHKK